jgi:ubiquinone/menaquinone biosynthesis C-methylase UbiE
MPKINFSNPLDFANGKIRDLKLKLNSHHSGNRMIDPSIILEKAHVRSGMHVADLGCGRLGHIAFSAASIVGDAGIVYAVDVLPDILHDVKRRADDEDILNIHTVWADLENYGKTAIPARSLQACFFVNVFCQTEGHEVHEKMIKEAFRLLGEKGRIVVVDWVQSGLPIAPPADHLVNFRDLRVWAVENGLAVAEEFTAGKYHHGIVFFKQD